jgi:nanoRNase/pAp phosphatase (c-di-AMP/oligoRNAs hydrolase)
LKEKFNIEEITFVHPKDMQDGKIHITENDITTNLPYVPGVHLAFDHHLSETIRLSGQRDNHIIDPDAPSAARVVYEYYGGEKAFPNVSKEMMLAVDKADSAQYTQEEVLNPQSWELLNFLMDARTGLGRFRSFRISNYNLMMDLIDYCKEHTIDEIMDLPDVKERVDLYLSHAELYKEQILRCGKVHDNVLVLDLREEDTLYAGNRFVEYALFPECNISVHIIWGLQKQNTVFAVGKSIFNRSSDVNIGQVMLDYRGGGHKNAGTCQIENHLADTFISELLEKLK